MLIAVPLVTKRHVAQLYVTVERIREELKLLPTEMQQLLHYFAENCISQLESSLTELEKTNQEGNYSSCAYFKYVNGLVSK